MNNNFQWFNRNLPQTLVNAQILCYINVVFSLIRGDALATPLFLLLAIGLAAGAAGIANEQKWGYGLAIAASVTKVVYMVAILGVDVIAFPWIINVAFDVALVALLLHPQSRNYQRVWFK